MKRKIYLLVSCLSVLCIAVWFLSCEGSESESDKGKKAANEFCDCLEDYSKKKCEEKFHDKYGKVFSNEFINSFNKAGKDCGVSLNKE